MSNCRSTLGTPSRDEVRKFIRDLLAMCGAPYVRGEYGADWTKDLRWRVRERDGHRCVICGTEGTYEKGNYYRLCVHHVDGDKGNSIMGNLVTLCWECHEGVHGGKVFLDNGADG